LVETQFRVLFVFLWVLLLAARLIPSKKAPTLKRTARERWRDLRQEGLLAAVSMIVATYGNLVVALLYLFKAPWINWSYIHLPLVLRVVGIILGVFSISYLYWVVRTLANFYSYTVEIQEDHRLIATGPYSNVRHPMYAGILLFLFSQVLVSDNWLFFIILLSLIPFLYARMEKEERMLLERFGEEYAAYMGRTGRVLPKLRRAK